MMALKLDASYRPIEVIDALEALVMCIVGKATPVETYNTKKPFCLLVRQKGLHKIKRKRFHLIFPFIYY